MEHLGFAGFASSAPVPNIYQRVPRAKAPKHSSSSTVAAGTSAAASAGGSSATTLPPQPQTPTQPSHDQYDLEWSPQGGPPTSSLLSPSSNSTASAATSPTSSSIAATSPTSNWGSAAKSSARSLLTRSNSTSAKPVRAALRRRYHDKGSPGGIHGHGRRSSESTRNGGSFFGDFSLLHPALAVATGGGGAAGATLYPGAASTSLPPTHGRHMPAQSGPKQTTAKNQAQAQPQLPTSPAPALSLDTAIGGGLFGGGLAWLTKESGGGGGGGGSGSGRDPNKGSISSTSSLAPRSPTSPASSDYAGYEQQQRRRLQKENRPGFPPMLYQAPPTHLHTATLPPADGPGASSTSLSKYHGLTGLPGTGSGERAQSASGGGATGFSGRAMMSAAFGTAADSSGAAPNPFGGRLVGGPADSVSGGSSSGYLSALTALPPLFNGGKPFVVRAGRTYLNDATLAYPLPVDLAELHRQSMRTLLLVQLFNAPLCSVGAAAWSGARPPLKVLEVACGSGFWSVMCHKYFAERGHSGISFVGIDMAPLHAESGLAAAAAAASSTSSSGATTSFDDKSSASASDGSGGPTPMKWQFVQHDLRRLPWPFADGDFDVVMVKDASLATPNALQQAMVDEYVRLLRPGGTLEIWDSDHTLRMLRPHARAGSVSAASAPSGGAPPPSTPVITNPGASFGSTVSTNSTASTADASPPPPPPTALEDEHALAASLGAYPVTSHTPLSPPMNSHVVEYNAWLSRALDARGLSAVPCTLWGPLLLQESEALTGVASRRLALPLSDNVRWELPPRSAAGEGPGGPADAGGVGGVVVRDGKTYVETSAPGGGVAAAAAEGSGKGVVAAAGVASSSKDASGGGDGDGGASKALTPAQAALRRTALATVVQSIQALEPLLREASGKSQDEWDLWAAKMMNDLVGENGTGLGECLEVGAWWARKKK